MKAKQGQTQAYLMGCGVAAVPPDHMRIKLHYVKSLQEMAAVKAGRRNPRELQLIMMVDDAAKVRDSISAGIFALESLRKP